MIAKGKIGILIACVVIFFACKKNNNNNQNVSQNCTWSNAANTQVNFTILNGSAQFIPISTPTGTTYVAGYGLKGIVIYRIDQNQFVAFERQCTHDGCTNNNAKVWVQTGNTAVKDSVCGSSFVITNGSILNGPASVGLYQYHTSWDGNQLQIYN